MSGQSQRGAAVSGPSRRGAAVSGPSRREVLFGLGGTVVGAAVGVGAAVVTRPQAPAAPTPAGPSVPAAGPTQAGIARPATPQSHGLLLALDLVGAALDWLPALGERILALTADGGSELLPDGARDLTVTVGLGPRLVAAIDPGLPGAEPLPVFAGDEGIDPRWIGGDILLAVYCSNPNVVVSVMEELAASIPGSSVRWSQRCFRAPGEGTVVRNPLGFHDGIVVPRTTAELAENVWIDDGPFAGGTVCVIRRLRLATMEFAGLPVADREGIIGRHHRDGSPLSGGGAIAEVDLRAKTEAGDYLTPARSHARAAHPSFTGSELMLRRGYAFDDGEGDAGLVFVCFQKSLRTFVATQQRLDEVDDLMAYARPTGSATFLVLPGFSADAPLGSTL